MLRRRGAAPRTTTIDQLRDEGWILPRALASREPPTWTLVGTVDSMWVTAVDPRGLVTPFGAGSRWSLDWWIGADDRWHFPSTDTGVRQHLDGSAPVVETLVRIPGGDAVQRVYAVRGERFDGGDEWLVVDIENRSSAPFALALAVRPISPEGLTHVSSIGMVPVPGDQRRDAPQVVTVDGRPGLVLGRRPARLAASTGALGDVAAVVRRGDAAAVVDADAGGWDAPVCAEGLAQAAFLLPVAHTTTIRVVLPVGADRDATLRWPAVVPPVAHVVAGWDAHVGNATRWEIPTPSLDQAAAAARRSLLLAPWSDGLRHAGPRRPRSDAAQDLVDAGHIVATLDRFGHHAEAARTLRQWPDLLASEKGSLDVGASVIDAVATHRLLAHDTRLFEDLLPDVVASVTRLDRASARTGLAWPTRQAAIRALDRLAMALDASDQPEGAADVRSVGERLARMPDTEQAGDSDDGDPRVLLRAAIDAITAGRTLGIALLDQALAGASSTFGFASRHEPQDLVAAALLLDAVRTLLVRERPAGLDLLPVFPEQWYGGPIELHDAPTAHGRLSYAVRWHGTRPALLWDLDPWPGADAIRITVPGLDPAWSTTQARGEALLAEVSPPTGTGPVRLVAEHPGDGGTFA